MGRLQGKVALVTGASRGIGAAVARALAAEGADVVATDIVEPDLAGPVPDQGRVIGAKLDVTDGDDWDRAVALTLARFGKLNILVNNAGVVQNLKPLDKVADAEWDRVIAVNLSGAFKGIRSVAPAMKAACGGSIINMSSIFGLHGANGTIAYAASKYGLRGISVAAAAELGRYGIRVNSIHPGLIDTNMASNVDYPMEQVPLSRMGRPDEVAMTAVFLASDESSFSTAAEFVVDGGDHGARTLAWLRPADDRP